jgi:plastocyanin
MSETTGRARRRGLLAAGPVLAGPVLAVLGLTACGGGSGGGTAGPAPASASASASAPTSAAAAGQVVTITGNNALRFMPMTIRVHPGKVRIVFKDAGAYPHNIVIPRLGITSPTVTGGLGEAQKTFTVTFPRAGRYQFKCQYHASSGMTGVFVVS